MFVVEGRVGRVLFVDFHRSSFVCPWLDSTMLMLTVDVRVK